MIFQEGDRVDHIMYNEGIVLMWDGGNMVKVQFDNGIVDWVYMGYCKKIGENNDIN